MHAFFQKLPVRIASVIVVAVIVFFIGTSMFHESQQLCMQSATPGTVLTVRGMTLTSTYVPLEFSLPTGKSHFALDTADGHHFDGAMTVYDSRGPDYPFGGAVADRTTIDFCNAMAEWESYTTETNGVITAYHQQSKGRTATGFTLTQSLRDGVLAPANAIVSPSGIYVAYITWDAELGATVLGLAEVSGKNAVVLASLTPEHGEMALNELSWSGSGSVAYAEITPRVDGPDANGNAHEKTLYHVDVTTHARSGVHIDVVP